MTTQRGGGDRPAPLATLLLCLPFFIYKRPDFTPCLPDTSSSHAPLGTTVMAIISHCHALHIRSREAVRSTVVTIELEVQSQGRCGSDQSDPQPLLTVWASLVAYGLGSNVIHMPNCVEPFDKATTTVFDLHGLRAGFVPYKILLGAPTFVTATFAIPASSPLCARRLVMIMYSA
ncbi:hypothetical protein EDD16DRAFT_998874 [Pisolithus croceorrhizus]|nr:hypothetical protein EDD16DRAFT_998874 [Pisolithus croceorrhizus]